MATLSDISQRPAPGPERRELRALAAVIAVLATTWAAPGSARADGLRSGCGALPNAYGPFDYRIEHDKLAIVEAYHFTSQVELLIRGQSGALGADLDYTLRAAPNHHRALVAMMRYGERLKSDRADGALYTVECYFERAVVFEPEDTTVRMIYATYLSKQKRKDEALRQLSVAASLAGDNGFTHYNLGLVYLDLGEYEHALEQAHAALRLGFNRQDLKERLVAAQKWVEPAPASAPSQQ